MTQNNSGVITATRSSSSLSARPVALSARYALLALGLFGFCLSSPCRAESETYTGTIGVSLHLDSACQIGGTTPTGNTAMGLLAFDTQTTFFKQVANRVLAAGSNSGDDITVTCSPGITPMLTVISGTHDAQKSGGHNHALANGSSYIAYDLYTDSSFATVVQNNTPISLTAHDSTFTVGLFGRAFGADATSPLQAGDYADTINVTISF
ncbi:spore coat protein U domain-containing protein [Asaia bogorensis]|nr:spore coat protein U domain-containing protein [Asaia bogorensis]